MNIQPLLDAVGIQEDAARAAADDLRPQIEELQARLGEAETHLEHLAITRKTATTLADWIPAQVDSPDLPEHPDYPRILTVLNEATVPLRARDVCQALDHELLPKNIENTRAKLKRLVKLGILTELGLVVGNTHHHSNVLPSASSARPWWWPFPLSIPAHIRLIMLLTCVFVLFVPRTTSPALLYTATGSHFLIGGRVVVGSRAAKRFQP